MEIAANTVLKTVENVVYAIVGLVGLFIFVVAIVCVSVHIYHCYSRRHRKQSGAVSDTGLRPSASSPVIDCQYVTLQTNDRQTATAVPLPSSHESVELKPIGQTDTKPPSYDEVMGCRWTYSDIMHPRTYGGGRSKSFASWHVRLINFSKSIHQ